MAKSGGIELLEDNIANTGRLSDNTISDQGGSILPVAQYIDVLKENNNPYQWMAREGLDNIISMKRFWKSIKNMKRYI